MNKSHNQESEGQTRNGNRREEKRIARLVQRKLEDYMNKTKREERFDPAGATRTTPKMHKYDLMYKVIEATTLEKSAREKQKAKAKDGKKEKVHPTLVKNSRQVTRSMEAVQISEAVSKVLDDVPVKDLTKIHSYKLQTTKPRPLSSDKDSQSDVRYQGYTSHVGSILQSKKYVEYYIEQGLNTGNPEMSSRLRDLKLRERRSSCSSGDTGSSHSSGLEDKKRTNQSQKSTSDRYEDRTAQDHRPFKESSEQNGDIKEGAVRSNEDKGSKEHQQVDEQVQTSFSSVRDMPAQTEGLTPTDSFVDSTLESNSTINSLNDSARPQHCNSHKATEFAENVYEEDEFCNSDKMNEIAENVCEEDEYSDDFEEDDLPDEDEDDASQVDEENGDKDTLSIHTYASIAHAEEIREEE